MKTMATTEDRASALADVIVENLEDRYEFEDELGAGTTSTVYLASPRTRAAIEGDPEGVAIKVLSRPAIIKDDALFEMVRDEIHALRKCSHPHIVRLVEVVCDEESVALVMEHLSGGELFAVLERAPLAEAHARAVFAQVVLAVEHLHGHGIAHRDIKAENIALSTPGDHIGPRSSTDAALSVKLLDLGSSGRFSRGNGMRGLAATAHYCAPEVVRSSGHGKIEGTGAAYTEACDAWSLGVLLYVMLSQRLPFAATEKEPPHEKEARLLQRVADGAFGFRPEAKWRADSAGGVSASSRELVSRLLDPDPATRQTIRGIKNHPWCASEFASIAGEGGGGGGLGGKSPAVGDADDGACASIEGSSDDGGSGDELDGGHTALDPAAPRQGAATAPPEATSPAPVYIDKQRSHAQGSTTTPWKAYLSTHLVVLESALSDAVNATMRARPQRPLSRLGAEVAARAAKHGLEESSESSPADPYGIEGESRWDEASVRTALERALQSALNVVLHVRPPQPLDFIAKHVVRSSSPGSASFAPGVAHHALGLSR
jgi:serine/threonine protein kinase